MAISATSPALAPLTQTAVGKAPNTPAADVKPAAAPAAAAKVDSDGDHDGSVGTKLNVKA
jgi:hypothetical protein